MEINPKKSIFILSIILITTFFISVYAQVRNPGHPPSQIDCDNNLCILPAQQQPPAPARVGIGTGNPSAPLDVSNPNNNGIPIPYPMMARFNAFTGAPGQGPRSVLDIIGFRDENKVLIRSASNYGNAGGNLVLDTIQPAGGYNTHQLFLSQNGNVGIGTDSPDSKLKVVGAIKATGDICTDVAGGRCLSNVGGGGGGGGWTDDGTIVRLTTSTDNVGIGTTEPGSKLHVLGNVNREVARFQGSTDVSNNRNFVSIFTTNPGYWWELSNQDPLGGGTLNGLAFRERSATDPSVARLYLAMGGNVGIGTTNPAAKLEVRGDVIARNANGGPGFVGLDAADPSYGDVGTINWKDGSQLRLRYWVGPQAIDVMTLAGGNVGIGTTNPNAKLDVAGSLSTDALQDRDRTNFFDGGCANNQYLTSISDTGQISCSTDLFTTVYFDGLYAQGDRHNTGRRNDEYFCSLAGMAWTGSAPPNANCAVFSEGGSWLVTVQPSTVLCRVTCFRY